MDCRKFQARLERFILFVRENKLLKKGMLTRALSLLNFDASEFKQKPLTANICASNDILNSAGSVFTLDHGKSLLEKMSKRAQWKQKEKELMTEIERLTAQVELLTYEVNQLKKTVGQNTEKSESTILEYPEAPSTIMKNCNCRGKCATRRCGCFKKNMACRELCQCSSAVCQNKEKNDKGQNKENVENNQVPHSEAKPAINNGLINVNRRRDLFSPDIPVSSSTPILKQYPLPAVQFKSPTKILESYLEEKTPEQLNRTEEHGKTKDIFDPMKPKHQLARTPPPKNHSSLVFTPEIVQVNEEKSTEERLQVSEEFDEPEVDWENYQAQLVPCKKCKRKFHPDRVEKHQECCKKV